MGDGVTGDIVLTYVELGERLNIKSASAKRLAQRRKWLRVLGNDGVARVRVPVDALPRLVISIANDVPDDVPNDVAGDDVGGASPSVIPELSSRVAHLEGLLEGLRGELAAERRRADAAQARTRDIEGDRDAWRRQAQRSVWSRLFGGE